MKPGWVALVLAFIAAAYLFGRCGTPAADARTDQLRWELGRARDSIDVIAPRVAALRDSTAALAALWRRSEAKRATEVSEAQRKAAGAQRRFQALAAALPDTVRAPIEAAHAERVEATQAELAVERARTHELARRLRVSAATVRLMAAQLAVHEVRDSAHAALVEHLEQRMRGNVSLLGFRFHARCGLAGAAGIDAWGRPNAVIGLGCSLGK